MEKIELESLLNNFSIITIGKNKVPNFPWKEQQSEKLSFEEALKRFNYKGGLFKKDGTEINPTEGIGIVTGFEHLECIDVDTKVFSTEMEKKTFWDEFLQTLKDNILDFEEKIVVYKTKSGGFHLLYKSKRVVSNTKIASLKGHKEAVLESRGLGGYIFYYPNRNLYKKKYKDIDFISDTDRDIIWTICRSYNYINEAPEEPKKDKKIYSETDITPWDDFNNKTDIWDVIHSDFSIPPRGVKNNHYLVKRHNATSEHSGYVFKDTGCLYLFSTGTCYPAEKLLSPFLAYCWKNHNGNIKEGTKDLYEQGYGSRLKSKIKEIAPVIKKVEIENKEFPLDVFPLEIQHYINECHVKLDGVIDYMGVSFLFVMAICMGNCFEIEVKRGWKEKAILWLAIVGRAGIGKTPSISNIIFPLIKMNFKEIKRYYEKLESYEKYEKLSKKEKEEVYEVEKPRKSQFIVNDITNESLVDIHSENPFGIGVNKDELAGWIKDMNKYRQGSDLEFWLSIWSGKAIFVNRMTRKGSFVEFPFIPVIGGIQPSILNNFNTEENKENGFMDRLLLSFPEHEVEHYNENELDFQLLKWYEENVISIYEGIRNSVRYNHDGGIEPITAVFTPEAKQEWKRVFNRITDLQNNENENEYMKSIYPKQKSYIPRFALIINTLDSIYNPSVKVGFIEKNSVLKAEKISDYFVNQAKKVKFQTEEIKEMKNVSKNKETKFEKFKTMYEADDKLNKKLASEILEVSRQTIYEYIKIIDKEINNK